MLLRCASDFTYSHLSPSFQTASAAAATPVPVNVADAKSESSEPAPRAKLERKPAVSPAVAAKIAALFRSRRAHHASLGTIQEIEDALRVLEASAEHADRAVQTRAQG